MKVSDAIFDKAKSKKALGQGFRGQSAGDSGQVPEGETKERIFGLRTFIFVWITT